MKNIVFIPAIDAGRSRHQAYHYSIKSWKSWADKNNCEVLVWDTPLYSWQDMTIPWQRYYLFRLLKENDIEYNQVLMVDSDTIVHPNCPNFFNLTDNKYCAVVDFGCWEWTARSISEYKSLFDNFNLDRGLYFNGGFQIVNKTHESFFETVLAFYEKNKYTLIETQKKGLGTDQTPVNYLAQIHNIDLKILPPTFNLHHLVTKNLLNFGQSWWGDELDNLYNQAWVYHFNSIPRNNLNRTSEYFLERAYKELYT